MSQIRSHNNRSTELFLRALLIGRGMRGWSVRPAGLVGKPDFIFKLERVAIFVDGDFWHGAPNFTRFPKSRTSYWKKKIESNQKRDKIVTNKLRRQGWAVLRFWDSELHNNSLNVINEIEKIIQRRGRTYRRRLKRRVQLVPS